MRNKEVVDTSMMFVLSHLTKELIGSISAGGRPPHTDENRQNPL